MSSNVSLLASSNEHDPIERVPTIVRENLSLLPKSEFTKIGFLHKLGHVVPNWLERFFALQAKHKELLYFSDYGAYKHYVEDPISHKSSISGSIQLEKSRIFVAFYAERNCTLELEAMDENRKPRYFYLSASDRDSMHHWLKKLTAVGATYVTPIPNAKELRYLSPCGPTPEYGMQGFMDKRGFVLNKGFKERFFRIQRYLGRWGLAYFRRYDELKPKGVIALEAATLVENVRDAKSENPTCQFSLQAAGESRVYILRTQTTAEKNIWMRVLPMFIALKDDQETLLVESWNMQTQRDHTASDACPVVDVKDRVSAEDDVLASVALPGTEEHKNVVRAFLHHPSAAPEQSESRSAMASPVALPAAEEQKRDSVVVMAKVVSAPHTQSQQRRTRAPSMVRPVGTDNQESKYVDVMVQGAVFAKHGHEGFPHKKFIFLYEPNGRIYWLEPRQSKEYKQKNKSLEMSHITDVIKGKHTDVFKRWTAATVDASCCLSLKADKRTLDLVAESPEQRDQWVEAIVSIKAKMGQTINTIEQ